MGGTDTILEVENVSKYFGTIRALNDITFALKKGKILGLVGDNNAGRTTLLKILSGGFQPSSGNIYLNREIVRFKSPADAMKNGIAIVYQFLQTVDIATIWENFFMGRELTKKVLGPLALLDVKRMKQLTDESIAKHGHTFNSERAIKELSGGQRQIIAVTRAINANPKILLLDEPTHGLSERVIREIFNILRNVKEEKATSIIITSQWYEQISSFVDDVIVLRRGEIVGEFETKTANKGEIFKLAMGLTG